RQHGVSNTFGRRDFRRTLLLILVQDGCHKDLRGITRTGSQVPLLEELSERDLSLFAVCRASAALAAAPSLGPDDIVAAALGEPAKSRALVSSWHGRTFFASRNRANAPTGMKMRRPIGTCSSCRICTR